jgi:putative peptidoglycan lipid II flippase
VLGQATGQASLPFFARLFGEKKMQDFADTVSGAIFRVAGASFLLAAWMMAAALPIIDIVYRRGRFNFSDLGETAIFFFWFALSLVFWAVQGLYARAFYAAGNTITPMVAGTLITLVSLPVYWPLFHGMGVVGLAIASDMGIAAHTVVLAVLLQRNRLVPAASMPWLELAKVLATAVFAGGLSMVVGRLAPVTGGRMADLASIGLISTTWAAAAELGLWITGSRLPQAVRRGSGA